MKDLIAALYKLDALRKDDHVEQRVLPAIPPQFANSALMDGLGGPLREALKQLGVEALFEHQERAIELIRTGKDVVLEAPTASGKTLCFNIPLVERLLREPDAHALMIHPMKALSSDQRRQFDTLAQATQQNGGQRLESWIYDRSVNQETRFVLRNHPPAVLFTNPEMLHQSFLQHADKWRRFLEGLKLVVLDEIHEYRGYFGTNVALLLRRFFAYLHRLGVNPQVVLATATCGNALEHANRLTGRRCEHVVARTPMRPERHFAFIDPQIPDHMFHKIYLLRIARAAIACVQRGLSTLIFCPTRRFVEEATTLARRDAQECGVSPELIAPYRSGYDAQTRMQVKQNLRTGKVKAVFTTNALEIGLDIGRLDACILAGFPDSVLSVWQRIGRAGRRWDKKAYVLFYALNNPFDRFYAKNIDAFLNKQLDEIMVGVDNEELMGRHLPFLAYECGVDLDERLLPLLGEPFFRFAKEKFRHRRPMRNGRPHYQALGIRGVSGGTYKLVCKGQEIGEISDAHCFREAYVGAIYNHFGKQYRVVSHGTEVIELEVVTQPGLRTEGSFWSVTQASEAMAGIRYAEELATCYGKLTVFENFGGYRLIDVRSDQVLENYPANQARSLTVRGFWMGFEEDELFGKRLTVEDLVGLEQLLRIGAPFVVPCDRHDLATLSSTSRDNRGVYIYETVPGGIGIAEKLLEVWPKVLQTAIDILKNCSCKQGCPSCLIPPRKLREDVSLKKKEVIAFAQHILRQVPKACREEFDPDTWTWVPIAQYQQV